METEDIRCETTCNRLTKENVDWTDDLFSNYTYLTLKYISGVIHDNTSDNKRYKDSANNIKMDMHLHCLLNRWNNILAHLVEAKISNVHYSLPAYLEICN